MFCYHHSSFSPLHPQSLGSLQEVCASGTNLGKPFLVHMVHHHDLMVEGDGRAAGAGMNDKHSLVDTLGAH